MKKSIWKKGLAAVMLFAMAMGMTACSEKVEPAPAPTEEETPAEGETPTEEAPADDTSLADIQSKGTLVLGTSADYPPFEFHTVIDGEDTIVGADIEVAKEIAKDLGVELEVKDMSYDGLLIALNAGKVDLVLAAMEPTDEKKENADFTDLYFIQKSMIVVKAGNEEVYKTVDDLKGKTVGVQTASLQESIAKEFMPESKTKGLTSVNDLIIDLTNDKVDAILLDSPVASYTCVKNKDLSQTEILLGAEDDGCAAAMRKGSASLQAAVNETLSRLMDEGKIEEFIDAANALAE